MPPADSYMGFVGVSTGGSSIRKVFPEWADALGLATRTLVGHDVPLDSPPEVYREVVEAIRDDPQHWGALVTTHKMAVHAAARDLFDELDELAETFGEISCIAKRDGRLVGSAKDPVTARLALEEFLAPDHFARSGRAALILGSGGAAPPSATSSASAATGPAKIICTALTQEPLDHARQIHERAGLPAGLVQYLADDGHRRRRRAAGGAAAGQSGRQRDRDGQGPARVADLGGGPLPRTRGGLGVQLPRTAGLLAPGARPAGATGAAGRGRLALLRPRLDPGGAEVFDIPMPPRRWPSSVGSRHGSADGPHRARATSPPTTWAGPTTTSTCSRSARCWWATSWTTSRPARPRPHRCGTPGSRRWWTPRPTGLGRRPEAVARISAAEGLPVVATTGAHREAALRRRHWLLSSPKRSSRSASAVRSLEGLPVSDGPVAAATAVGPTGEPVRAGVVKAGIGYWGITAFEHRVLAAVARPGRRPGAPVMVHLEHGSAAFEVLAELARHGVPASAVALAHVDRNPDPGLHAELAARGAYLGYDGFARSQRWPDSVLLDCLERSAERGAGRAHPARRRRRPPDAIPGVRRDAWSGLSGGAGAAPLGGCCRAGAGGGRAGHQPGPLAERYARDEQRRRR